MDKDYKPKEIEENIQQLWKKSDCFKTVYGLSIKVLILTMFFKL